MGFAKKIAKIPVIAAAVILVPRDGFWPGFRLGARAFLTYLIVRLCQMQSYVFISTESDWAIGELSMKARSESSKQVSYWLFCSDLVDGWKHACVLRNLTWTHFLKLKTHFCLINGDSHGLNREFKEWIVRTSAMQAPRAPASMLLRRTPPVFGGWADDEWDIVIDWFR